MLVSDVQESCLSIKFEGLGLQILVLGFNLAEDCMNDVMRENCLDDWSEWTVERRLGF